MAAQRGDYCGATTRAASEAGGWAASQAKCSRKATEQDEKGKWWCWQHVDRDKRY